MLWSFISSIFIKRFSFDAARLDWSSHEKARAALIKAVGDEENAQDLCFGAYENAKGLALFFGLLSTLAVATLSGFEWSKFLAILPALSAFFLTSEKTFAWRSRSGWHCEKRIGLERLLARLESGEPTHAIRKDLLDLDEKMSTGFPHGAEPDDSSLAHAKSS